MPLTAPPSDRPSKPPIPPRPGQQPKPGSSPAKDETPPARETVIDVVSGRRLPLVSTAPRIHSGHLGWRGIHVEEHALRELQLGPVRAENHLLVVHLEADTIELADDGPLRSYQRHDGQISFFPAGSVFHLRSRHPVSLYTVSLTPEFVASIRNIGELSHTAQFRVQLAITDWVARHLCDRVRVEIASDHPLGKQYAEALGQALAAHALRHYTCPGSVRHPPRGGLSSRQLHRTCDYIRSHLTGRITLASLARTAGLSEFHFARAFRLTTGLPPLQYVIRQRVEHARNLLTQTELPLAQVAEQSGFRSQSHFSSRFRRLLGVTPLRYRGQAVTHRDQEPRA